VAGVSISTNIPGYHGSGDNLVMKLDNAGNVQWQRDLGGSGSELLPEVQQTSDGGYFVLTKTESNDGDVIGQHGSFDGWGVKLSVTGAIEWQRAFGGSGFEAIEGFSQTSDGGFVIIGGTTSSNGDILFNHGGEDLFIIKLDNTGSVQWSRAFGGSDYERAYAIQQTTDEGFIVAGTTNSNDGQVSGNHGDGDIWVLKLNSLGNIQWKKALGGSSMEQPGSIQQTTDGGYVVAGLTWSNDLDVSGSNGGRDFWVVKLSEEGMIEWQKALGGSVSDDAHSIFQTNDGGYIVEGYTYSNDGDVTGQHGGNDHWIVKLSEVGDIQWEKALGGSGQDAIYSIQQTTDGGFVLAGESESSNGDVPENQGLEDLWMVKLSDLGEVQWTISLGGSKEDEAKIIQQTSDGGYFVLGTSFSNNGDVTGQHGNGDFWILKFSPDMVGVDNIPISVQSAPLEIFPNPSNGMVSFQIESEEPSLTVLIADFLGRLVKDQTIPNGGNLDLSGLPTGIYSVIATTPLGKVFSSKICKQE